MSTVATRSRADAVPAPAGDVILEVRNLVKHFHIGGGGFLGGHAAVVKAVDDVSLSIRRGETLGLVGESGCGKTTTGRCILMLERPTSGQVIFEGRDLTSLGTAELRAVRRKIQGIFQDPYSSLNPRMTVVQMLAEPIAVHAILRERINDLAAQVTAMTAALEGDNSAINEILAKAPQSGARAARASQDDDVPVGKSLADRIRSLQEAARRAKTG